MSINFTIHNKQTNKYIPIKVMPMVYSCFFLLATACSKLDNKYQAINAPNVHEISVEHVSNKSQEYPLHSAIRDGDLNELQRLLSTGQDNVNAPDKEATFHLL